MAMLYSLCCCAAPMLHKIHYCQPLKAKTGQESVLFDVVMCLMASTTQCAAADEHDE